MKGSDLFLQCLQKQGVQTIFGLPGEENADMMKRGRVYFMLYTCSVICLFIIAKSSSSNFFFTTPSRSATEPSEEK